MDDVNWILELLGKGVRWDKEKDRLRWSEEDEKEDIEKGNSMNKITTEAMIGMCNSICNYITFTGECSDQYDGTYARPAGMGGRK